MLRSWNRRFEIGEFLAQEREKDLLRFSTAGSVDDGKSTLIGRLLYDTQAVYEDQVRSIEGKGTTAPGQIDFALLTDGLRAEREQGITIDVAYRYFSTARRKFIIADTPGHEQYTRNMATGASTADAAIVLIDASKGVLIQSRRHAYIASLLRVRHVLVAVNKMDLIGYDEGGLPRDRGGFQRGSGTDCGGYRQAGGGGVCSGERAEGRQRCASARKRCRGTRGRRCWSCWRRCPLRRTRGPRLSVFRCSACCGPITPSAGSRGRLRRGRFAPATGSRCCPSGRRAKVERIVTFDGDLDEAVAPLSVTLVLDRELDISRGDLIAGAEAPATVARSVKAALVWMDERPLELNRRYLLKHTSQTVPAFVASIDHRVDLGALTHEPAQTLHMNDIGAVTLNLLRPIARGSIQRKSRDGRVHPDRRRNQRHRGGWDDYRGVGRRPRARTMAAAWGRVTAGEREARWGHRGGVLELHGPRGADRRHRALAVCRGRGDLPDRRRRATCFCWIQGCWKS